MRIVQFIQEYGTRAVAVVSDDGQQLNIIDGNGYLRDMALEAHRQGTPLVEYIRNRITGDNERYDKVQDEGRLLPPLDHPDPAHCILSGTGLDHLGSAKARDSMHAKLDAEAENLTDSMRMFQMGLEAGKPSPGEIGVQPEWFYKGDGDWLVAPGHPLERPAYALDGGDEPEMVGLYVIAYDGTVLNVGFAIGNEYSDHVMERQNYLYLAHSKLRSSSFGPELRLGRAPANIEGTIRIIRDGDVLWQDAFLTGEENMTHSIANIEHHHFKYANFRRVGDVHCHFFGTATLSIAAGVSAQDGDIFEISAPSFGRPLVNQLVASDRPATITTVVSA